MNSPGTSFVRATFAAGIATFLLIIVMAIAGGNPKPAAYPNPEGFTAAMYWFEVTENTDDLFRALGDPALEAGRSIRASMDRVNRIDFAFMVSYSLFFALLVLLLRGLIAGSDAVPARIRLIAAAGVTLSILMLAGDILENLQLLKLTAYASPAEVDTGVISLLMAFTRVKWFAIFLASLALAVLYARWFGKRWPVYVFVLLYGASGIIGFLSFFIPGWRAALEISANLMGAAWLASTVHAGIIAFRKGEPQ